jgi:hypothetical protein
VNDDNTTGASAGNPEASQGPGTPPVVPPLPSRPPTSSLPGQGLPANGAPAPEAFPGAYGATDSMHAEAPYTQDKKQLLLKVGFIAGGLAVLGLLIWWLTALLASGDQQSAGGGSTPASAESSPSTQASRGELPQEGVSAQNYQLGDCFEDFDPEATESTVVACNTGHSAQLVAVHWYPESDSYPGTTALRDKGREICLGAELTDAAANYVLMQRNAYPSDTSWEQGDRRVDCYVTADKGNIIKESLVP